MLNTLSWQTSGKPCRVLLSLLLVFELTITPVVKSTFLDTGQHMSSMPACFHQQFGKIFMSCVVIDDLSFHWLCVLLICACLRATCSGLADYCITVQYEHFRFGESGVMYALFCATYL